MSDETVLRYVGKCLLVSRGKERVLVVGDLHLGYEESLNRSGVLVSRQMFEEMMSDFNAVFGEVGMVDRIVLLGDVKHDFGGISRQEWNDVMRVINYLKEKCKKLVVVKGNHDNILPPILKKHRIKMLGCYVWEGFAFLHGDENYEEVWEKGIDTIVVGHGHPAVNLEEGAKTEKYKCFLVGKFKGKNMIVVPSFIEYYAGSDPRDEEVVLAWDVNFDNFDVKIVPVEPGEMDALDFGKLKNLK